MSNCLRLCFPSRSVCLASQRFIDSKGFFVAGKVVNFAVPSDDNIFSSESELG